ncbi:cytochrome P450 [Streptomyces sp. SL13]|uniref:Cytochrome P450 n=1 Tax=Streptantibioticus silvisoli TaxID=2705255 RepID=A0AA90HE59_9ACTN|nr:cytochrome P450 [Streptantibioticus silvisoli]MDI5974075.1 cytochrome P450 [Streptantibioticus silvisoli]
MTVDLSDPIFYQESDPGPVWARLRAEQPVHRNVRANGEYFWAVMNHRLCTEMLTDPAVYSSENGMRLDSDPRVLAAAAGRMLNVTDPPRHDKMRKVISAAFTRRMVDRLEATMRRTAAAAIDEAIEEGECEFTTVAQKLPVSVICDMMGVPQEDWGFMVERTRFAWSSTALDKAEEARKVQAHTEILIYFQELAERRRADPQDDLMSALVHGEIDGARLSEQEVFYNCDALISGGNETTRHATVGGLLAFVDNPGQWRTLRDEPVLMESAIQEVVRYTTPVMHALRTATTDVELGGERISAGDHVVAWLPSANRDAEVFADPDRFLIDRSPNRHLGFIQGNHYCIGSALAKLELTVMFDELQRRVEVAELTGPVRRLRSNLLWGFDSLPVRLLPRKHGTGARATTSAASAMRCPVDHTPATTARRLHRAELSPQARRTVEDYEGRYRTSFDHLLHFDPQVLRTLHGSAQGSGDLPSSVRVASATNPEAAERMAVVTAVANLPQQQDADRERYLQALLDIYGLLPVQVATAAAVPGTTVLAPEREGRILADLLGVTPHPDRWAPQVKRMPVDGGLLVGVDALPSAGADRLVVVDGVVASGVTLMATLQLVANPGATVDVFTCHATAEGARALTRYAEHLGLSLTLHVGHVSGMLNEKFYSVEPDAPATLVLGDIGDTISPVAATTGARPAAPDPASEPA